MEMASASSASNMIALVTLMMVMIGETFAQAAEVDGVVSLEENPGYSIVQADRASECRDRLCCHQCFHSVDGQNCVNMLNTFDLPPETCHEQDKYCVVEWMKTRGELTTFSRGCGRTCTKEGHACMNDGRVYERCSTCCTGNLCNKHIVEAGASHKASSVLLILGGMLLSL